MLCVCKDRKRKFQSLGISIKAELWDFKTNQPKDKCPNRERIAVLISEKINETQKAALDKRIAGKDFTAATLIESTTNNTTNKTVGEYYLTYIQNLQKENRIRYEGMFEVSYTFFIKFNKHLDIPFSDIDVAWLKRYEKWMREQNLVHEKLLDSDVDHCVNGTKLSAHLHDRQIGYAERSLTKAF